MTSPISNYSIMCSSPVSSTRSASSCTSCGKTYDISDQLESMHVPSFCSDKCDGIVMRNSSSLKKSRSTFRIMSQQTIVWPGNRMPAFEEEYTTRRALIEAWATAEWDLSVYTMDLYPYKQMLDHEEISPWTHPQAYYRQPLTIAYNKAHHDECEGLYMQACTSLLSSICRVFLMHDLTKLGIARSKLAGICLDQEDRTTLDGEDVIGIPEQLFDTELIQLSWFWPTAIQRAIALSKHDEMALVVSAKDQDGTFDFDKSHWDWVTKVVKRVSGCPWEN